MFSAFICVLSTFTDENRTGCKSRRESQLLERSSFYDREPQFLLDDAAAATLLMTMAEKESYQACRMFYLEENG